MKPALQSRKNMELGQLITNDILDKRVLQAMFDVPREEFVPEALRNSAYADEDIDVGNGRFLIAPLILAKLLELAEITAECRVLVIGALSGYCAGICAHLATHVVAIESDAALAQQARAHMARLNLSNVDVQQVKSLADGYAASAPYDIILIAGAIDFLPEAIGEQLALGGRLVTVKNVEKRPGIRGGLGRGLLVKRINNQLHYREHFDASSPLMPSFAHHTGFVF